MTVKENDKDKKDESDDSNSEKDSITPKIEFASVEEAMAEVERLRIVNKEVIDSRSDAKSKLKAIEEEADKVQQKELEDQGKYKDLLAVEVAKREGLETTIRNNTVDSALRAALEEAGVASSKTAMKLIARSDIVVNDGIVDSKSVVDAIATLKTEHEILFSKVTKAPTPKKADEEEPSVGFEAEMTKATNSGTATRATLDKIRAKYNRL